MPQLFDEFESHLQKEALCRFVTRILFSGSSEPDMLSLWLCLLRPQIHLLQITCLSTNVDFYSLSFTLTCYDLKGLKYPGLPSSDVAGKILSLDLQDPRIKPVELRMPRNFDLESFNPHGISVYIDQSGE